MFLHTRSFYKTFSLLVGGLLIIIIFVNVSLRQTGMCGIITSSNPSSSDTIAKGVAPPRQLVDLTNFEYLIENNICSAYKKDLFAIVLIFTATNHVELRATHRQAITQKRLSELGMQRVFLIAAVTKEETSITQDQLVEEHAKFGDLLQGNFDDTYRNLSYKNIMGLQWAATECKKASFIIKLDDDIVHDIFRMRGYLENILETNHTWATSSDYLAGIEWDYKEVVREKSSKWYVTEEEYAPNVYPSYLNGWLYITNPPTALRLVEQSKKVPIMWVDDAWVTGILRESIGIPLTNLEWVTYNTDHLSCCIHDLKTLNLECPFYLGCIYGNESLIVEFLHSFEKCYYYECVKRTDEQWLSDNCTQN